MILYSKFIFVHRSSTQPLETMAKNSKEYAARIKARHTSFRLLPITVNDLLAFIAMIIFMGMVTVPAMNDYWNDDNFFGQDFMRNSFMSR